MEAEVARAGEEESQQVLVVQVEEAVVVDVLSLADVVFLPVNLAVMQGRHSPHTYLLALALENNTFLVAIQHLRVAVRVEDILDLKVLDIQEEINNNRAVAIHNNSNKVDPTPEENSNKEELILEANKLNNQQNIQDQHQLLLNLFNRHRFQFHKLRLLQHLNQHIRQQHHQHNPRHLRLIHMHIRKLNLQRVLLNKIPAVVVAAIQVMGVLQVLAFPVVTLAMAELLQLVIDCKKFKRITMMLIILIMMEK